MSQESQEQQVSKIDDSTFLITSYKREKELLERAVYDYDTKQNYRSTYFNESSGLVNIKTEELDNLALNAQTSIKNIIKINNIVRYFINKNDILGKIYEAIENNVNSEYDLIFPVVDEKEKDEIEEAEKIIKDFNNKINLEQLILDTIPMAYSEGNYFIYLRKSKIKDNYQVDYYPLGVVEVADYTESGEPYLLLNVKELETRLNKIYKKYKNNTPLFYNNADEEIKDTYPDEVYRAYKNKEIYAKLNIENTGVIRVNNMKRKYGLTPIFKSLKQVLRLENIELSDDKNTLVRGKKIIFQKLSKELFINNAKENVNVTWSNAQAKAHLDLMAALNGSGTSVYTGTPWVESVAFVEPTLEPTNVQVKNQYRTAIMTAIGISYLNVDKNSFGAAQISVTELMKTIDKICIQLANVLVKWYKGILIKNNIDVKYCPKIKVMNSEKLSTELSIQLAKVLNSELNASLETTYKTLGLDIKNEARRREREKELGYEEIFQPRMTAHTNSGTGNEGAGRPSDSRNRDKQNYDQDYNQNNGR